MYSNDITQKFWVISFEYICPWHCLALHLVNEDIDGNEDLDGNNDNNDQGQD